MNNKILFSVLTLLLLFVTSGILSQVSSAVSYRAILYEQVNSSGMHIEVTDYVRDLTNNQFANRTRSACVVGLWLFYDRVNYGLGDVFVGISGSSGNPVCFNLGATAGQVSSIRYAGSYSTSDLYDDSLTLYEYSRFRGSQELILNYKPLLSSAENHVSMIITGYSNWTAFEGMSYSGPHICIVPTDNRETIDDIKNIGIRHGALRSIRKGCEANPPVIVRLQSSAMGESNKVFRQQM